MTNSSKAWPDTQYNGNAEDYEEYDTDREAWLVDKGYDEWMEQVDPRITPRVDRNYTVRRADDPSGQPAGTHLFYESAVEYRRNSNRNRKQLRTQLLRSNDQTPKPKRLFAKCKKKKTDTIH